MSTEPTSRGPTHGPVRRSLLLVGLLAFSLVASALLAARVSAAAQPPVGYAEVGVSSAEMFQVLGPDWTVRTNLSFLRTETVRVNVSSATVDVLSNAGGVGALDLVLQRYSGATVFTALFVQGSSGALSRYTASIDLSLLALAPDWYYLRILIDDNRNTFEAMSVIKVDVSVTPHSIETYTDDTFSRPSDVFTTTSTVWVRVRGEPAADGNEWDLAQFVNRNSPVNGPHGGFSNFDARGDIYTFSIDLSAWAGNFVAGWSYTLFASLTNNAFDAGKQIQIFDPTLTVSATDIAPASARQGQTSVPMLALSLALNSPWPDTLGPASYNLERLRIVRTGSPGVNADVVAVHLWDDVNGNQAVDAGDLQLASVFNMAGVPFPVWIGQNGVTMTTVDSAGPRNLLITFDISPTAAVGDYAGAQIAGAGDMDVAGHFAGISGLPAQSTNVLIAGRDVLTVTNDPGAAPATATTGQVDVPIDRLTMSSNGPVLTVNRVSVYLQGTGVPADLSRVALHADNGDGVYDPATDPLLGTPSTFPASGPVVFAGLSLNVDANGRSVWIVYDIAASATIGDRVGSRLPDNTTIGVTGATVYGGTFPLDSGLVTIRGPILTVTPTNLAPAQARQGRLNVPMLRLSLSVDFGQVTVSGLRADKRGTSTSDADVSFAAMWLDNGNGVFDLGDTFLGKQAFVGGTTVIAFGSPVIVTAGVDRSLFLTYDISATATLGVTVSARLADATYVPVNQGATVSDRNFPIASSAVQIVAAGPGAILSIGSVDLAVNTPQAYLGQTGVAMEKLILSADQNQAVVSGMRVDKRGTSTLDSDVAAVKLYRDANANGNFDLADTLLSTTTFVAGAAIFGSLALTVQAAQPVVLFIVIDVSTSATLSRTVGVALANENYIAVDVNSTVDPISFPIRSSTVLIVALPLGSISGTVKDNTGKPLAGATVSIPELLLTATTDANGNYTFANITLGTYHVVAVLQGYGTANVTVTLTAANPNQIRDITMVPAPATLDTGAFLAIGGGLGAIALLAIALLLMRRRSRCPVCGKPKPRDREVCAECEAKGLRPPAAVPPPPPSP